MVSFFEYAYIFIFYFPTPSEKIISSLEFGICTILVICAIFVAFLCKIPLKKKTEREQWKNSSAWLFSSLLEWIFIACIFSQRQQYFLMKIILPSPRSYALKKEKRKMKRNLFIFAYIYSFPSTLFIVWRENYIVPVFFFQKVGCPFLRPHWLFNPWKKINSLSPVNPCKNKYLL